MTFHEALVWMLLNPGKECKPTHQDHVKYRWREGSYQVKICDRGYESLEAYQFAYPDDAYIQVLRELDAPKEVEGSCGVQGGSVTDHLLGTMDAVEWANAFCKLNNASDKEMMIAWFANAIMCGYDHADKHMNPEKYALPVTAPSEPELLPPGITRKWLERWLAEDEGHSFEVRPEPEMVECAYREATQIKVCTFTLYKDADWWRRTDTDLGLMRVSDTHVLKDWDAKFLKPKEEPAPVSIVDLIMSDLPYVGETARTVRVAPEKHLEAKAMTRYNVNHINGHKEDPTCGYWVKFSEADAELQKLREENEFLTKALEQYESQHKNTIQAESDARYEARKDHGY